jgi:hypothetical protein
VGDGSTLNLSAPTGTLGTVAAAALVAWGVANPGIFDFSAVVGNGHVTSGALGFAFSAAFVQGVHGGDFFLIDNVTHPEVTVQLIAMSDKAAGTSDAMTLLQNLSRRLDTMRVTDRLDALGLSIVLRGTIQNISLELQNEYEGRAVMAVTIRMADSYTESVDPLRINQGGIGNRPGRRQPPGHHHNHHPLKGTSPMASISKVVNITVSLLTASIKEAGFGIPLVMDYHTRFSERIRFYGGQDEMISDGFVVSDPAYIAAGQAFAQSPAPEEIAIGRKANMPTLSIKLTPTAINSKLYSVKVTSPAGVVTTVSFTSDGTATVAEIVTGLVAVIKPAGRRGRGRHGRAGHQHHGDG